MKKSLVAIIISLMGVAASVAAATPAGAQPLPRNGQLVFTRTEPTVGDTSFTVDPNGGHVQPIGPPGTTPRWSPDGHVVAISGCPADTTCASSIVNPDTGATRVLPEPAIFADYSAIIWSPDGSRLAGGADGNDDASLNGIYTVRSSDGGGLTRVTTNPTGSLDIPGDYSPDGGRLVFIRNTNQDGQLVPTGLFTVRLDGTGLRRLTPAGMILNNEDGGSWSPSGNRILFVARPDADQRGVIWVVKADGTELRRVPIPGCGGLRTDGLSVACLDPAWSPDGTKIAFIRFGGVTGKKNVYTVNADGTSLNQVTFSGLGDSAPDWGTHPVG
jgi:Tol biopolymer transport system component